VSILALASAGVGIFKNWSEHKNKIKLITREGELKLKEAEVVSKLRVVESQHTNNTQIDLASINKKGWMDELIGLTTFFPLTMMLLVAPLVAILEVFLGGSVSLNLTEISPGETAGGATGYTNAIFMSYDAAFIQLKGLPQEYWWGAGLVFIHFLGMRGFVTQIFASWSGKGPLINLGKSKSK